MKNKIILPLPEGLLKSIEAYEKLGLLEKDIKQLQFEWDMHDLFERTFEIELDSEPEDRIMVSTLIVKAYLAGKHFGAFLKQSGDYLEEFKRQYEEDIAEDPKNKDLYIKPIN